jgi:hypothetical protein
MKRLIPLLILVIALLVAAPAALAAGPSPCDPGGDHPACPPGFGLVGTVSAVDATNGVLTVVVDRGSDGISGTVDVAVTADTRLFSAQCHKRTPITLSDIVAGDRVVICGTVDDTTGTPVYTAGVVCVRVQSFRLVGTVTAVDATNGVLSVAVDRGFAGLSHAGARGCDGLSGTVDITVTPDTKIVRVHHHVHTTITLGDIAVGDKVGAWGTVDDSTDTPVYTAAKVCVRVPSFGLVGSVTALDAGNGVLSVAVDHGSGDLSGTVDVVVATGTQLYSVQDHQRTPITLADIAVGDEVAAFGTIGESTGAAVYTADIVLDGVSADWLPRPVCRPHDAHVSARRAGKGDKLRLHLKVADAMPGCTTARVALKITTATGRTVTSRTIAGVAVNTRVTVSLKLSKALRRGNYRLVATSVDWAGNRQARAKTAVLTVK